MNTGREKEVVAHAKLVRMIEAKIPDCVALQVHRTKYGDTALRQVLAQYMRCEVHTLEKKVGQYAWSVLGPKRGTGGRGPEGFAKAALLVLNAHSEELSRLHASEQHAASGRSAAEAQSQLDERRARDVSNAAIEQQNAIDRLAFAQRQAAQARLADQPLEYLNAALAAQEASRAALANGGDDESEGGDDSGEESDEAGGDEELALEPAAGAGAMHGDDAGGAVEANEGGDQTGGGQCGNDQSGAGQSGADESSGASDEAAGGGAAALKAGAPSSAYAAPIERPPQPDPRDPSPFRVVALPSLAEAEAALAAAEASTSAALADPAEIGDAGPLEQQQEPRQQRDEDEGQANAAAEADDKRREAEERAEKAEERAVKAEAKAGDAVAAAEAASEAEAKAKAEAKELAAQLEAERVAHQLARSSTLELQAHPLTSVHPRILSNPPYPPTPSISCTPAPALTSGATLTAFTHLHPLHPLKPLYPSTPVYTPLRLMSMRTPFRRA